jgi:hypothetical protein
MQSGDIYFGSISVCYYEIIFFQDKIGTVGIPRTVVEKPFFDHYFSFCNLCIVIKYCFLLVIVIVMGFADNNDNCLTRDWKIFSS